MPRGTEPSEALLRLFDESTVERVESAVAAAERRSATEIVVYVVGRSADYPELPWKGVAVGGAAGLALATLMFWLGRWGGPPLLQVAAATLIGAGVGWLAFTLSSALRRLALTGERLGRAVERRAGLAFLDERVYATRDGTGLLILISLFERRCVVLPDRAVSDLIDRSEWGEMASAVAVGVRAGKPAPALVAVITQFGELLEERGLTRRRDDEDELSDTVRLEER